MPANTTQTNSGSTQSAATPERCTVSTSDGRRCTALVYPGHASLCHHHLRLQLDRAHDTEDIAADILSSVENFQSATAVNAALGRILTLLAAGRIKRQDAIAMSYICQLMLQSLKGFKQEIRLTRYEPLWERDLAKVLFSRTPLQEFIATPEPELAESESDEPAEPNTASHGNVVQGFSPAPPLPARENLAPAQPAPNSAASNASANSAGRNVVQGFSPAPSPPPTGQLTGEANTPLAAGHKVSTKGRPSRAPAA